MAAIATQAPRTFSPAAALEALADGLAEAGVLGAVLGLALAGVDTGDATVEAGALAWLPQPASSISMDASTGNVFSGLIGAGL